MDSDLNRHSRGTSVLLGLSGGVDSAAAASLLTSAGYKVTALTLRTWKDGETQSEPYERAARVARSLGIDHIEMDVASAFYRDIVCPFVRSWRVGETPNPCVLCNPDFKFRLMLKVAEERGLDLIATGHYARLTGDSVRPYLCRALDRKRDQSYFLYRLNRKVLNRTLFPLGSYSKSEIRAIASVFGDSVAQASDSQDICFLGDTKLRSFLAEQGVEDTPGFFLNTEGEIIGEHTGSWHFSEGQRRRLGIATGRRMTVLSKDTANNTVILGYEEDALIDAVELSGVVSIDPLPEAFDALVQIRSQGIARPARITTRAGGNASVIFPNPQRVVSPGQSAVFYWEDRVLGGGIVRKCLSR